MDDDTLEPAPGRGPLFWVAVAGGVVALTGALYLFSRSKRGRKLRGKAKKAAARVKGGLLTAVLAGAASRISSVATSRVVG